MCCVVMLDVDVLCCDVDVLVCCNVDVFRCCCLCCDVVVL